VKAVLLAAGHGLRLRPLTRTIPKILVDVGGRTLLERQLEYLARNGVTQVVLKTHHLGEQVASSLRTIRPPLAVQISHEERLSGTAGALRALAADLTDTFIVLYGDVITDADLVGMVALHRARQAIATLACYLAPATPDKGLLRVDEDGKVAAFVEKRVTTSEPAWINAGLYVLEPAVLEYIRGSTPDFGHDVFPLMLRSGCSLCAHPVEGQVIDVGTPDRLALARRMAGRDLDRRRARR
jgi:NDP-sugar pyrophosphorylase family protein